MSSISDEGRTDVPNTELWDYARQYYKDESALASFELLERYRPGVVEAYLQLRRTAFSAQSTLPDKVKELVILAIECARTKTNPPPVTHARLAVDAGATLEEIAEVVALCIPIAGMLSYQETGRYVLEAAVARQRELDSAST